MQKFPRDVEEVDGHGFNSMNFFQGECSPVDRESTFRYVSEEYDFHIVQWNLSQIIVRMTEINL